ncbi:MAG: hypothetical protein IT431_01410 [Phycisphaerales bacterium]|nr:hypothetical protein [Phycisphaerales bacterium]
MPRISCLRIGVAVASCIASMAGAQSVDEVLRRSFTGQMGDGTLGSTARNLEGVLEESPGDNNALAALGVVQFLQSGELILQQTYTYGGFNLPVQASMMVGVGGMGQNIAFNPEPRPINHAQFRASFEDWIAAVARAEATLARVGDEEVKVRIPIGLARLDLNADGTADEREQLWRLFRALQTRFEPMQADADAFEVAFDRGDVAWLRGYCHLCMAVGEFFLAHDSREAFERAGHVFYAKNETPYGFLKGERKVADYATGVDVTDIIALVHLLNFECVEPGRMEVARGHLLETFRLANEMWRWYDAETDDDREWIPNPTQVEGAIPEARITQEMHDTWLRALGEGEQLLRGERLLRFWRGDGERGVNVRRFFAEPRRFDLVLWVQGSAAAPYLEEGEFTSDNLWRDLEEAFNRGTFRYMWWMN